jgi:methylase of polypeptide subunit release factors
MTVQNIFGINVVVAKPNHSIDGGGTEIYQEAVSVIQTLYPQHKFKRAFEWCAGPGILGFALLGSGVADSLCLADMYEPSLDAAKETIKNNNLNVDVYVSNNLHEIPSHEQWDLIISNPPHFANTIQIWPNTDPRLYVDKDWNLHKEFFNTVCNHLTIGGKIFLWEATWGSSVELIETMITGTGLAIKNVNNSVSSNDPSYWYWIELERLW